MKQFKPDDQMVQDDFKHLGTKKFERREVAFGEQRCAAEEMYTGQQHVRLMRGIKALRDQGDYRIDLHILSAGYGLIPGDQVIAPYEVTFQGMGKPALREWADFLQVSQAMRKLLARKADLTLLLLGDPYLEACALDDTVTCTGPVIAFCGTTIRKRLPEITGLRYVTLSNPEAKRFSCGLVGLKGELVGRMLEQMSAETDKGPKYWKRTDDPLSELEVSPVSSKKTAAKRPERISHGSKVDYVIKLPKSYINKPHRKKIRYFIPEWDDLVDGDFDFVNDAHSGGRGDWSNEVYAHQMFDEPNYDGLLVSRVVAKKSKKKAERINQMGIHRYLRVPDSFSIMGDCGAFGYLMEDEPPFSTDDLMNYYTDWGFNYGVSIDHLIVKATMDQAQDRYDLTIAKSEEFIKEHRQRGLKWTPIGAVQGWDPESYAAMAKHHFQVGYDYIALGGLVRSTSDQILAILKEVRKVLPNRPVDVHLFGVSRPGALQAFSDAGATSVDSASYLRQAWMNERNNYHTFERTYCALRIPEVGKSFRAKRAIEEGRLNRIKALKLEKQALDAVRGRDAGKVSADAALNAICEYDAYIINRRVDRSKHFRDTLVDRPWKECPCPICREAGVETVIFRGNNRNRRRGFHNTYIFYQMVQRIFAGR